MSVRQYKSQRGFTFLNLTFSRRLAMAPTRRDFLKISSVGGTAAAMLGFDLAPAYAEMRTLKIDRASETRSTCPYCSVSCGVIIYTQGDGAKNVTPSVVNVEGDPDHPGTNAPGRLSRSHASVSSTE